ncbi:MAG: DUF4184 family protein [Chitinophagaceae bacterium]
MPFTFAHPAIILPFAKLQKGWVSLTGLIIGSIVPDFEYFIRMDTRGTHGHTFAGVFYLDFPLSLLLCFVFHNLIRNALIKNLSIKMQQRFVKYIPFQWNAFFKKNWNLVVISIFIGIGSHFLLDSFTNSEGYFVNLIPFFKTPFSNEGQAPFFYQILYNVLSITGLIIMAYAIWRMPVHRRFRPTKPSAFYWTIIVIITLAGYFFFVNLKTKDFIRDLYVPHFANFLIIGIGSFFIGVLIASIFFARQGRYKRQTI